MSEPNVFPNGVMDWQRRFRKGPAVWAVLDKEGNVGELYETEAGAQAQMAFLRRCKQKGYRVARLNIHDDALAFERWGAPPHEEKEKLGALPYPLDEEDNT